jgi:hypothetical protein
MSQRDDIEQTVLEGDPYERAATLVNRLFPFPPEVKILACVLTLASSSLLAPLLYRERDRIERLEGTETLAEALSPSLATLTLFGIVTTFASGLVLVSLLMSIQSRTLSTQEARRLVRIEDLVMVFAAGGILFIASALFFALTGTISTGATERLYDTGIKFYNPDTPISVDSRLISGLGPLCAIVLYVGLRRYRRVQSDPTDR